MYIVRSAINSNYNRANIIALLLREREWAFFLCRFPRFFFCVLDWEVRVLVERKTRVREHQHGYVLQFIKARAATQKKDNYSTHRIYWNSCQIKIMFYFKILISTINITSIGVGYGFVVWCRMQREKWYMEWRERERETEKRNIFLYYIYNVALIFDFFHAISMNFRHVWKCVCVCCETRCGIHRWKYLVYMELNISMHTHKHTRMHIGTAVLNT